MESADPDSQPSASAPPIYILSGGVGASGEQLVHTVLAQFPDSQVPVITVGNIRHVEQISEVLAQVKESGGTIVHTLVDPGLRRELVTLAEAQGVAAIDLMGDLFARLTSLLGSQPAGQPGLYRRLHQDYFDRVAAIEFTMAHDDGKYPAGWPQADILILGPSRSGKTPLSLYLSVLGWKVANYPLVPDLHAPPELSQVDRSRMVGLRMEPGQLLAHRQQRQIRLGAPGASPYADPSKVYEEMEAAVKFFRRHRVSTIDVTDKPLETSAEEIIRLITRQTGTTRTTHPV